MNKRLAIVMIPAELIWLVLQGNAGVGSLNDGEIRLDECRVIAVNSGEFACNYNCVALKLESERFAIVQDGETIPLVALTFTDKMTADPCTLIDARDKP